MSSLAPRQRKPRQPRHACSAATKTGEPCKNGAPAPGGVCNSHDQTRGGRRCKARSRTRDGEQCLNAALTGTDVCHYHGGKAPQVRAKVARDRVERQARETLGRLSVVPVENPLAELQLLAGEAKAWKELLADHVAELKTVRYGTEGGEQIRGEIVLFERAMDRLGALLASIARLNIDERLVKIEERQADLVARAMSAAFAEMGLPQDQQREAIRRVGHHLRLVAG